MSAVDGQESRTETQQQRGVWGGFRAYHESGLSKTLLLLGLDGRSGGHGGEGSNWAAAKHPHLIEGSFYLGDTLENVVVTGSEVAVVRYLDPLDVLLRYALRKYLVKNV
ncbi:unnamed protein product [Mesocestoides corti]|uniref:AMP_N domain-containing protein n=1 Tax=Mesocestoides corti TaxID=53468 RepID=A0A0R3UN19_MESCO|nr:unnamed protein product [Mesocestoides corti]